MEKKLFDLSLQRDIRRRATSHLKRHYVLLVMLCAISIFLGTEFTDVVRNAQNWYDVVTDQEIDLDLPGVLESRSTTSQLFDRLLDHIFDTGSGEDDGEDDDQAVRQAAEQMRILREETDPHSALGRSRGALAAIVNNVSSGQLYALAGSALYRVLHSHHLTRILMVLGALAFQAFIWVFLRNVYCAILRRAYLEVRTYDALPVSHLFHFKHVRRWIRVSLSLLVADIYETLWWLTLIGGAIKHYSYFMVPFIVAENPDVTPNQAVRLSRRMMDGHKWECFLLDVSYLGWMALGFVSFGVGDVLWSVPYRMAGYTEYYVTLRQQAIEKGIPGSELLNDACLYAPADAEALRQRYPEVAKHEALIEEDIVLLKPRQDFLVRNFGIWTGTLEEKKVYSTQQGLRQKTRVDRMELNGEAYPERMNPLWRHGHKSLAVRVSFMTPCTVWSLIVVFFSFCFLGWLWEVSLHLITDGGFANRGALHGPWLPIYGSGVTMIVVLLYRLRRKPLLEAAGVIVLCGLVEYFASYFMERSTGLRWWDYSGYFLNLNGRICGEGLAMFCVGGMAAVYLIVPLIDGVVTRVRPRVLIPVCLALLVLFTGDVIYSRFVPNMGEGITDFRPPSSD